MGINNMSTLKLAHLKEQSHIVILRKMNLWSLTITNRIVCVANDKNNNDKRYSTKNEIKKILLHNNYCWICFGQIGSLRFVLHASQNDHLSWILRIDKTTTTHTHKSPICVHGSLPDRIEKWKWDSWLKND